MMPIILKDHSWSQSEDKLFVRVPVKGIRADRTSFITSDNYIRVYYPPYYFELFLWGEVDEVSGKCTLSEKEGQVLFELPKKQKQPQKSDSSVDVDDGGDDDDTEEATNEQFQNEWPCLELEGLNRFQKHEIRTRACEMSQKRAQTEIEAAANKRVHNKQMTVQEQIRLDEEARRRIAEIKTFETESFMKAGSEWQDGDGQTGTGAGKGRDTIIDLVAKLDREALRIKCKNAFGSDADKSDGSDEDEDEDEDVDGSAGNGDHILRDQIWSKIELASKSKSKTSFRSTKDGGDGTKETESGGSIAPVRQGGSIKVSFTPRQFPTPSRESTAGLEEEWLAKQLEARKNSGFDELKLKPEERDPSWLLDKGYSLMETASYLGAASAFSTGLKLAPKLPELYVGRGQAQLALNNVIKAVEDCSQALQLLTPKVAANAKERLTCLSTRARGFAKLNMYREAIEDYRGALQLDPKNEQLREEYAGVQREELKSGGDGDGSSGGSEDED